MEESLPAKSTHQVKLDIINALKDLEDETRREVLDAVGAFYRISLQPGGAAPEAVARHHSGASAGGITRSLSV
ncbi:MAG: hypothetical protein ACP5I8_15905 [Phycisphaerae bacterium]